MRIRKFAAALFLLLVFIVGMTFMLTPQVVHAQCGLPGLPDCPPKKRPTLTPRPTQQPTATPSATIVFQPQSTGMGGTLTASETPTATFPPLQLTAQACWEATWMAHYRNTAIAIETQLWPTTYFEPTAEETMDAVYRDCMGTAMAPKDNIPLKPTTIPPIAGPVFLRPGVVNGLILVLLIGLLLTGGLFIWFRRFIGGGVKVGRSPGPSQTGEKTPGPVQDTEMNQMDTEMNKLDTEMKKLDTEMKKK